MSSDIDQWEPAVKYSARLGGNVYRNIKHPIVVHDSSLINVERHAATGQLGLSFEVRTQDLVVIPKVDRNVITQVSEGFEVRCGDWGQALVQQATGRIWCDLRLLPTEQWELDCSCVLVSEDSYPVLLHPDRTLLGKVHGDNPPNFGNLTLLQKCSENRGAAIVSYGAGLYVIGMTFEGWQTGIHIRRPGESFDD